MRRLNSQHASLSDPVRMAMSYAQDSVEHKRLAAALHRVHDDPDNVANPNARRRLYDEVERGERLMEGGGLVELSMRRGSFVVDVGAGGGLGYPGETFATLRRTPAWSRRLWSDSTRPPTR
ncbi:hypothetical protein ACHAW5_004033 [Stephanodiscus triporus]|uniref:Uncharacterized protein n=1 Tax=Stephanodiscus triporus TaxID=2934178 RepID=A0ABD3NFR4_9STRA